MSTLQTKISTNTPVPGNVFMEVLNILIGRYVSVQTYVEDPSVLQPQITILQAELRKCSKAYRQDKNASFDWRYAVRASEDFFLENSHRILSGDEEDEESNSKTLRRDLMHAHNACIQPVAIHYMHQAVSEAGLEYEAGLGEEPEEKPETEIAKPNPRSRMH